DVYAHCVCNDVSERGLAETGRTAQQNMLEHIAPFFCRFHHQFQAFTDLHLTGEFAKHRRPQRDFESDIWFRWFHRFFGEFIAFELRKTKKFSATDQHRLNAKLQKIEAIEISRSTAAVPKTRGNIFKVSLD